LGRKHWNWGWRRDFEVHVKKKMYGLGGGGAPQKNCGFPKKKKRWKKMKSGKPEDVGETQPPPGKKNLKTWGTTKKKKNSGLKKTGGTTTNWQEKGALLRLRATQNPQTL